MGNYKNKVVWITGASSGIGKGLVKSFNQQGAKVILSSRKEPALNEVISEFNLDTDTNKVLPLDLEDIPSLEEKTKQALALFGRIDVMIHNGGISQRSKVLETKFEVYQRLMSINYLSYVAITKYLLPSMIENGGGQFVVVSSLTGKFGTPLRSGYAASKHALHGFFDSLRAELSDKGIKVLMCCPGFINTNVSVNAFIGDGSSQGTMDQAQANGMPVEKFTGQLMSALDQNKDEVYIGGKEKVGVYLKRFLPKLFNHMIQKAKVT